MIFNYVIVFLIGMAIGCNFMAYWKDRKHPIQSGKVKSLKPWPSRLKPGLHGGMMVLNTNTSAKNPFLKANQDKPKENATK